MSKIISAKRRLRTKICEACHKKYVPNKFHPHQKVCSKKACQKARARLFFKKWLKGEPDYYKHRWDGAEWSRKWRKKHPKYYIEYRKKHKKNLRLEIKKYIKKHIEQIKNKNTLNSEKR